MNSRPRQSNSMTGCCFAGSPCSYGFGAVLIEAVDSRCASQYDYDNMGGEALLMAILYLAVLALPYKVGLASAAAHLILLLVPV